MLALPIGLSMEDGSFPAPGYDLACGPGVHVYEVLGPMLVGFGCLWITAPSPVWAKRRAGLFLPMVAARGSPRGDRRAGIAARGFAARASPCCAACLVPADLCMALGVKAWFV